MYTPSTRVQGDPIQTGLDTVSYLGPRYLRERTGDFTDSRLAQKLSSLAVGTLVLLPEHISGINVEGTSDPANSLAIHLTEIPELAAGRENSRHEVKFGQLHMSGEEIIPITELVAAKYLHRVAAPRELHSSLEINRRFGEDVAFTPLGFVRHPETNKIGYLSRYEHGVVTLDNVLWEESASPTLREEAMGFAGLWLASLHNHAIIHGDAQAKNIARDSSQRLRYPDLEGAHTFDPDDPMSRIKRLVDVSDVFNRVYMPETSRDENEAFIEGYLEHQHPNRHDIDAEDIEEVIEQARQDDIPHSA